jgi:flagellar FliL protein
MAQAQAATPEEVAEVPAKKGGKKKLLIIVAAAVALTGGGGFFLTKGKNSADEGGAHAKAAKAAKHVGPPVFLQLDAFVVNLQPAGSEQYLQTEISLRLSAPDVVDEIKGHMPEVRSRVLMLLSTKSAQELLTATGKKALAEAIRVEIVSVVDPDSVSKKPAKVERQAPAATVKNPEDEEPAAQAPADGKPGEATTDTTAGQPQEEAEEVEPKVISVLFTSFIIQ